MGYNTSATTITLTAKLTPIGRQKLILTNNNLISSFSLGDSDANYYTPLPLTTGQVPTDSGLIGPFSTISNSVGNNIIITTPLLVNETGVTKKAIQEQSNNLSVTTVTNGITTISGSNITHNTVSRDSIVDPLTNLFYSFNLPLNSTDDYNFTGLTTNFGGFSNTGLSGLAQTNILVIGIGNSMYGEMLDGKSLKVEITTTASTYTIYSTFQNNGTPYSIQDVNYTENASNTQLFGKNIVLLFSDDIQKPNGDSSLSWSTGYNSIKPFTINGKRLYNLVTDSNVSQTADTAVGIAYLDKGFIVITEPTIVSDLSIITSATTVTFNSISTDITQNVTCIANRGEFGISTNRTFESDDTPRISEVGLYDADGDLIAIAKTDRHIEKGVNEFLALGIKISL